MNKSELIDALASRLSIGKREAQETLDEVLEHYARGGDRNPDRSRLIRGFSMTAQEKCDIVAFLESLTDEELLRNPELSDPWKSPRYGRKGTSSPGAIGGAAAGP